MTKFDPSTIRSETFFKTHLLSCSNHELSYTQKTPTSWLGKLIRWLFEPNTHIKKIQNTFVRYIQHQIEAKNLNQATHALMNLHNFEASVVQKHNQNFLARWGCGKIDCLYEKIHSSLAIECRMHYLVLMIENPNQPLDLLLEYVQEAFALPQKSSALERSLSYFHSAILNGFCIQLSENLEQNMWTESLYTNLKLIEQIDQVFLRQGPKYSSLQISDKLQNIKQKLESVKTLTERYLDQFEAFSQKKNITAFVPFWKPGQIDLFLSLTYLESELKDKLAKAYAHWQTNKESFEKTQSSNVN